MIKSKLIISRKSRNISQTDIATYLKISQTQYQKREAGKIKIMFDEWKKIAKLLNMPIEDIFEEHQEIADQRSLKDEIDSIKKRLKILETKLAKTHI
nr:helix-turn-helix transcriptional regulator [uncultured Chryseobacterium sp.]